MKDHNHKKTHDDAGGMAPLKISIFDQIAESGSTSGAVAAVPSTVGAGEVHDKVIEMVYESVLE